MFSAYLIKSLRLLPILALSVLAWLLPTGTEESTAEFSPDKVNLALRRTADGLLRLSGDSTSRIPAIEQYSAGVWQVRLDQPFSYEKLPALLQASLEQYDIHRPYEVAIRRCDDATIDLGYHQLDYTENKPVPCGGRAMPEGCHYIEVSFTDPGKKNTLLAAKAGLSLLILGGMAGYWFFSRKKPAPPAASSTETSDWLPLGNSQLDVAGQILICNGVRQTLTFRETKLLRLFATHPDQLLERDFILRNVWADEGILVGRSIDMFVSRLRKKLAADPGLSITSVHGVGYRLETGKT